MKRVPRLTKKEKKALNGGPRPQQAHDHGHSHIHCTSCGKHLDIEEFEAEPATAEWVSCQHGSQFASCVEHIPKTRELLAEHDRTGQPVKQAAAWH